MLHTAFAFVGATAEAFLAVCYIGLIIKWQNGVFLLL